MANGFNIDFSLSRMYEIRSDFPLWQYLFMHNIDNEYKESVLSIYSY